MKNMQISMVATCRKIGHNWQCERGVITVQDRDLVETCDTTCCRPVQVIPPARRKATSWRWTER